MTLAFFLPELISAGRLWVEAAVGWLAALGSDGEALGLILLLGMSIAVPIALWWSVYRTLLAWLRARPDFGSRRR